MSTKLLLASAALLSAVSAQAAVSVTSAAFTYAQSFDSLAATGSTAWTNDATLAGWSLFRASGSSLAVTAGTGSSNAGGFYSFGVGTQSDRALGSVASGSTGTLSYVLALTNDSGSALNSFTLRFDGEQWRHGGATSPAVSLAQNLKLEYGFGTTPAGVAWQVPGGSFDFTSPVFGTSAVTSSIGNSTGLLANLGGTVATNWAQGSTLWIRWVDTDSAGADHGLAIDNVSFSVTAAPVPEPGTCAMLLAGLGAVGFIARRRRG